MDNNLGTSLYGGDTPDESIKPDFEKRGGAADKLSKAENAAANIANTVAAAKGGKAPTGNTGGGKTGGTKDAMKDGLNGNDSKSGKKDKKGKGFYNPEKDQNTNNDNNKEDSDKSTFDGGNKSALSASPFVLILLGVGAILALIVVLPVLMIGAIDYNLQKILGFDNTIMILEKVGQVVTGEFLSKGKVPSNYASDLAKNGIDVGQVLANGDFVKTDTYIADIENRDDLVAAAGGFSYISDDEGELAILYDGKIIRADEFVAAVESDPVLYAAYSTSADIATKYYYSDEVETVYKDMELSRGNFNDLEITGNYNEDDKNFNETLEKSLNNGSNLAVGGAYKDLEPPSDGTAHFFDFGSGTYVEDVTDDGDINASKVTGNVAEETREYIKGWERVVTTDANGKTHIDYYPIQSDNSTERAAELLNTAISSSEPYLAANAFISVEEPIQKARVDGDGLVNHIMNLMTKRTSVSYQNVETGATETKTKAILETENMRAAISDSNYSKDEAANFGRDRVLKTTSSGTDSDIIDKTIKKTTVTMPTKTNSSSVVRNGKSSTNANAETIAKAKENLELSQANDNYDKFPSVVGGNRIVEGGSVLRGTIDMAVIGAMGSDEAKLGEYHEVVSELAARREEADRATKSPFDISSPNTFLGSIVHNFATSILGNYGTGLTTLGAVTSAGQTTGKAIASLTGAATAYGGDDEYTSMAGINCRTVEVIDVKGDLYCTPHNTPSTAYMDYDLDDFKGSEIGDQIGDDGEIKEGTELWEFVHYGMDRYTTVGVKSAEICEKYRNDHSTWTDKIKKFFKDMVGTYDVCDVGDDDDIGGVVNEEELAVFTGSKYTFAGENKTKNELYGNYVMYDEVKSLLSEDESAVARSRREYEEKHPKDDSEAAVIARRSGMSKKNAEIALAYSDYLTMIANYDASDRFAFTAPIVVVEKPILEKHSDDIALNLYAWRSKESEYDDLRTRNFVV